jgi:N4-gp56 family major capsid protein
MALTSYSDITPRQTAFSVANLLKRAMPHMMIERFGQAYPIPKNNTKVAKWRRYFMTGGTGSYSGNAGDFNVPLADTPLTEGVTPAGSTLENKDYTVTLQQYGDFLEFSDVIQDTHEDFPPLLREMTDILGEQAAHTIETLRFNVLKAGTNVFYANGANRAAVNTEVTLPLQRRITRSLKRQNAKPMTAMISSTVKYNTQPIEAAFIALCHPDVENDIRDMAGFISVKQYGSNVEAMEGEIGSVEDVRYIRSTVFESFPDAGGTTAGYLSTTGTSADVYPIIYLARDAYGIVPLRGKDTVEVMVVQPKATNTDPLAQRGTAGWKSWNATVILQDAFMVRAEVAASE